VFCDTVLENAKLANATLRRGSLTRVLVDGGRLTGLHVAETELRDCVWQGCGADMASFRHSTLERTTFHDCSLREADFMGLRGGWVRFHDCDLRGASFVHAQVHEVGAPQMQRRGCAARSSGTRGSSDQDDAGGRGRRDACAHGYTYLVYKDP